MKYKSTAQQYIVSEDDVLFITFSGCSLATPRLTNDKHGMKFTTLGSCPSGWSSSILIDLLCSTVTKEIEKLLSTYCDWIFFGDKKTNDKARVALQWNLNICIQINLTVWHSGTEKKTALPTSGVWGGMQSHNKCVTIAAFFSFTNKEKLSIKRLKQNKEKKTEKMISVGLIFG